MPSDCTIVRIAGNKISKLDDLWKRVHILHGATSNQGDRLDDLLIAIGGNPDRFDQLADAVLNIVAQPPPFPPQVLPPPGVTTYGFSSTHTNVEHFLTSHTYDYLEMSERLGKSETTLWPDGTTASDVMNYLDEALDTLHSQGHLPTGPWQQVDVTLTSEVTVRVGTNGGFGIGQFTPISSSSNLLTITKEEMNAMWRIFGS